MESVPPDGPAAIPQGLVRLAIRNLKSLGETV
jgi:hypothetical protein